MRKYCEIECLNDTTKSVYMSSGEYEYEEEEYEEDEAEDDEEWGEGCCEDELMDDDFYEAEHCD